MQVEVLELTFGNAPYVIEEIDGLGAADIRNSQFLFSGRDGGMVTDQFYGFRDISVTGKILSATCAEHDQDRLTFSVNTPIGQTIPVYVTTFSGQRYLAYCKVVQSMCKIMTGGQMSDFMLLLRAGDPLFYSTEGGDEQTATVLLQAQTGGYVTPYDLPVDWAPGAQPSTVLNSGNATAFPIIELHDEAHDPRITNQTTGETFGLNISMADGDTIIIDMYNRTVTLNGSNIMGNRTDDSTWWGLTPGDNSIVLTSNTSDDNVYAELTWRNGLMGI